MIDVSARRAREARRATRSRRTSSARSRRARSQAPARDATLARIAANESLDAATDATLVDRGGDRERATSSSSSSRTSTASRRRPRSSPPTRAPSRSPRSRARTKRPEQVIGMHFMNPVPVMQLVEVIRGLATSDATTQRVLELCKHARQDAGRGERLSGLRRQPRAHADDQRGGVLPHGGRGHRRVDRHGDEARHEPSHGPLALADLIGLDTCVAILEVLHEGLGDPKYRAVPAAQEVRRGRLARPEDGRGFYAYS